MSFRILFALSPVEWRTFFPGPMREQVLALADDAEVVDPLTLSRDEWNATLSRFKPQVLVAAWKCLRLPEDYKERTDGALGYVCYLAGSVKKLVSGEYIEDGLKVTNWGGVISRTVAEQGLMLTIACLRRGGEWNLRLHQEPDSWKTPETVFHSLFERRVGIHGFGFIAREFARLIQPFDCSISTYSPSVPQHLLDEFGAKRAETLEELFSENEVIVELAALTPETEGIVTEKLLRSIPEDGVFVNIGRGAVVDEDALARIAAEGKLQVGLDVYGEEPLPADSPFRKCPNVILMPHLGGPTTDRRQDSGRLALRNLKAYQAGEDLEALITPQIFARAT
jgi:phosphoglycerate dehydrogenase-like enzyme